MIRTRLAKFRKYLLLAFCVGTLYAQDSQGTSRTLVDTLDLGGKALHFGSCLSRVSSTGKEEQVAEDSLSSAASPDEEVERESTLFRLAVPGMLKQHASMEYMMWRKHLYGTIYGDPPPLDNPLLTTQNELSAYLDSVKQSATPGGILVYWRSDLGYGRSSDLCVGLVLPGRRMLVEASPLSDAGKLKDLLNFDRATDARAATLRKPMNAVPPIRTNPKPVDLATLSRALLPPVIANALEQHRVKSLLVVPIEGIGGVPFAALPIRDGATLIDYATVEVAPGFRALQDLAGSDSTVSARDQMLIVGDPDLTNNPVWIFPPLPGARLEAEQVANLFGKRPLIGKDATRQAVVTTLTSRPTPKLIYFATHAIADPVNPQDGSFLGLTGANLRTREIGKLKLTGHPLVVLSACQTGLGKVFDQGGIFGMALAWDYAGAGAVVMSLWNVPDLPTRDLMFEFSSRLSKGELPAEALAGSMRTVRQHDPDPRDWAGFTVFGGLPLRAEHPQSKTQINGSQRPSSTRTQAGRTK